MYIIRKITLAGTKRLDDLLNQSHQKEQIRDDCVLTLSVLRGGGSVTHPYTKFAKCLLKTIAHYTPYSLITNENILKLDVPIILSICIPLMI